MVHRVQASISRSALVHNLRIARQCANGARVVAVVKADAYGHGLLPVAEALQDADLYGVTDIDEAERLRAGGSDKGILILQGLIERSDITRIAQQGFQVVLHRPEHLHWLEDVLDNQPPPVPLTFWLKLDSGMGRLGIPPADYVAAFHALRAKPWTRDIVLMSHCASASNPDAALNARQLQHFAATHATLANHPHSTSVASSAILLAFDTLADWVRPGLMLYGNSPFAWQDTGRRREHFALQAAMTLQARLLSVKNHPAGDSIGYNEQYVCPRPMRVGIVSIGYGDGYPSGAPNHTPVVVHGQRSGTLGRVSMDMLAVDLSEIPAAQSGDLVTLWGDTLPLDEVAAHTGILSYNLTCSLNARVPRIHV